MKKLLALDIEVLPNYFLIVFKNLEGKHKSFESKTYPLHLNQRRELSKLLTKYTTFGFNSNNYDMPIINAILSGADCEKVYAISKDIVSKGKPQWLTYTDWDIEQRDFDHFDLVEPSPAVMISLKNYATRVGSKKLQEFYLEADKPITDEQITKLKKYCINDVDVTIDLYNAIADRIDLRLKMSEQYGLDLRSKSDAQIAETVIASELQKKGVIAKKPTISSNYKARYKAPDFISFKSESLRNLVKDIENTEFELAANGSVKMPKLLANHKITIGNTTYKMGIGGLHSQEKSLSVVSNDTHVMRNADFTSYYPFIILNNKLFPKHLGVKFLDIYRDIVNDRIKSKKRLGEIKNEIKHLKSLLKDNTV